MEIEIKKAKESRKGILLSSKNVKLTIEISVLLSDDEKVLINKYYDPDIKIFLKDLAKSLAKIKVYHKNDNLSGFRIIAQIGDGFNDLGIIQRFSEEVIGKLNTEINYLKALDKWEGEGIIKV